MIKGKIIGGSFNKVIVREKQDTPLQLGELLISEGKEKILLQVYDLSYASQLSQQHLELLSGLQLEKNADFQFMEHELRNYKLAFAKNLVLMNTNDNKLCKTLPAFFGDVREITKEDFIFKNIEKPIFLGKLRSGNKMIDVDIILDGEKAFAEHLLIAASTGKGKSNLTSCLLYSSINHNYCGILILDPHDEYYGRNKVGLKNHPKKEKVIYYTAYNPPPGTFSLRINLSTLKPQHFTGVIQWSDAQREALYAAYRQHKENWINSLLLSKQDESKQGFQDNTLAVVKRKLMNALDIKIKDDTIFSNGVFDAFAGSTTVQDICNHLEKGNKVIIDTSQFSSMLEILLASVITSEIFQRYKHYKITGELDKKPIISIVLEEAPRVLGREMVEQGNIFSTIAREGRKFKVGLIAITQVPSLIPREILANMNTKIILGIEMAPERQAIIESSPQDLSDDSRTIASLDKGEAIVTSTFLKFATPIKIPLFEEIVRLDSVNINNSSPIKLQFVGVNGNSF